MLAPSSFPRVATQLWLSKWWPPRGRRNREPGTVHSRVTSSTQPASPVFFFFFLITLFMSLFSVVLGLPYCGGFSLAEASGAAPTVARASRWQGCSRGAHRAHARLSWQHVGSIAVAHRLVAPGMWDLPGSATELASPALVGGFFAAEPPGKPCLICF